MRVPSASSTAPPTSSPKAAGSSSSPDENGGFPLLPAALKRANIRSTPAWGHRAPCARHATSTKGGHIMQDTTPLEHTAPDPAASNGHAAAQLPAASRATGPRTQNGKAIVSQNAV